MSCTADILQVFWETIAERRLVVRREWLPTGFSFLTADNPSRKLGFSNQQGIRHRAKGNRGVCSRCGLPGHNKTTCPERWAAFKR